MQERRSTENAPRLKGRLVVAMPAYNEADGIVSFLGELAGYLEGTADEVTYVVVDDASTDSTPLKIRSILDVRVGRAEILRNETNRGHGPSTYRALYEALELEADWVLQMDSDGQLEIEELGHLVKEATDGADVVMGYRIARVDPWFRLLLSAGVRRYLSIRFGVRSTDPNSPFRLYRAPVLRQILERMPQAPIIPSIYSTVLAPTFGRCVEVPISHRRRRGETTEGTTWGTKQRRVMIPTRLIRFCGLALRQLRKFEIDYRKSREAADHGDWIRIGASRS